MEWVVTTGRTVGEAIESGLDQLGVDEHDAEVEVVQEPQKGLFGRLRAEATVRMRVRPTAPRPKVDRRDRRRAERRRGRNGERHRGSKPAAKGQEGGRDQGARDQSAESAGPRGDVGRQGTGSTAVAAGNDGGQTAQRQSGSSRSRRRRRRGGRGRGRKTEGANVVNEGTPSAATATDVDIEGQRQAVETFLTELLGSFGRPDATVAVTVAEDEAIEASVDGPELGLLVGHKGVALQAVQELARSVVQRQFVGQTHARIRVDIAGYRARRKEALERFARHVAETVKTSGVAKALDPMSSADRKVVHDVVNEVEGVSTVSEGEDAARRVVIRPS